MAEQNRSGAYTQFVYSPTGFEMQIMNGQSSIKSIVALPAGNAVVYTAAGQFNYYSDHLGSFRFASTTSRTMYFDLAFAPFGETYATSGSTDPAFTGQRQDTVSGLYDFPAREYSIQGRWPSPDPAGLAAVDPTNPQSWNRYAYVMNNPLLYVDPSGAAPCTAGGGAKVTQDGFCLGNSLFSGFSGGYGLLTVPIVLVGGSVEVDTGSDLVDNGSLDSVYTQDYVNLLVPDLSGGINGNIGGGTPSWLRTFLSEAVKP